MTNPEAPTLSQLERARLDNRDVWRNAGIASLVLVFTGVGIALIPIICIYALLATRRNERMAREGLYDSEGKPRLNERALQYWLASLGLIGVAVIVAINAVWPVAGVLALILAGVGVALQPWRHRLLP